MKKLNIPVLKMSRMIFGVLLISFITPIFWLPILNENIESNEIIIRLLGVILIIIFVYFSTTGKMILKISDTCIDLKWKRKIVFEKNINEKINLIDINSLIIDNDIFLRKIITTNKEIEISNTRPVSTEFQIFVSQLKKYVLKNGGHIITSKEHLKKKGYYEFSFELFVISLAVVLLLMDRLWKYIDFYVLLFILIPIILLIRHFRLIKRKKY